MLRLLAIGVLAACSGPSPYFRDVPVTRVIVDGSVFDVRVKGEVAEALRVNAEYAPRLGPIADRAGRAIAQVSGCEIKRILGDQALVTGLLQCDGKPNHFPTSSGIYHCDTVDRWVSHGLGIETLEIECSPY